MNNRYKQYRNNRNFSRKRFPSTISKGVIINAVRESRSANRGNYIRETTEYVAKHRFEDFPILEQLKRSIASRNYTSPTPIQDQAIPAILEGKDVTGIANTGTGKTAAFLIPLIDKVLKDRSQKVLIITPTRELALQIDQEFQYFTKGSGIYSALCIGGKGMFAQRNMLRVNPNFVIGTPGRINDLIKRKSLHLSQFGNVVLDEADRMVDIGFIDTIKYFVSLLPQNRQSMFFSATISGKVNEILQSFVRNPVTISVKQQDAAGNIYQDIVNVANRHKKIDQLHDLLIKDGFEKVLVFGRTKWGIQKLADMLQARGLRVGAIHGNKNQNQRQRVLEQFKKNEINILLATDVASRGLDIPDVSHVINYDLPATYDDYIHRIGRTGRANKRGIALTFVE